MSYYNFKLLPPEELPPGMAEGGIQAQGNPLKVAQSFTPIRNHVISDSSTKLFYAVIINATLWTSLFLNASPPLRHTHF